MELLTALIVDLIVIAVLFEVARRASIPYPALFVLGGLALGFIPGLPSIQLEPELVLLVFLPPLLFVAAFETPIRDLRRNLAPIVRLSIALVILTAVVVAAVAQALVPTMGWAAAFALGAIVAPTDALAATSVFRRIGVPKVAITLIEGESLFNDATALVAYRTAVIATVSGTFVVADAVGTAAYYVAPGRRLGVNPVMRLFRPPKALLRFEPEHVLVGHGEGLHENATEELRLAVRHARRDLPRVVPKLFRAGRD